MSTHTDDELAKTEKVILDIMQTHSTYNPAVFPSDEHYAAAKIARHVHQNFDLKQPTKSSGELEEILAAHARSYFKVHAGPTNTLTTEEAIKAIEALHTTQTTKLQAEARISLCSNILANGFKSVADMRIFIATIRDHNELDAQLEREHKVKSEQDNDT